MSTVRVAKALQEEELLEAPGASPHAKVAHKLARTSQRSIASHTSRQRHTHKLGRGVTGGKEEFKKSTKSLTVCWGVVVSMYASGIIQFWGGRPSWAMQHVRNCYSRYTETRDMQIIIEQQRDRGATTGPGKSLCEYNGGGDFKHAKNGGGPAERGDDGTWKRM